MEVQQSQSTLYLTRTTCDEWSPIQSPVFHACMVAYLVAFLIPQSFKYYAPALRIAILVAVLFYMIWGALYWCTWDILLWSAVFIVQNTSQLIYIFYTLRRTSLPKELEGVYAEVFEPFGISRQDFQTLCQHHCKTVRIHPGDKYAVEGCASVDERVSLLISGRMRAMFRGEYLHDISENELIDSVEWEGCKLKRGEIFQVTIEAVDRCSYLCWNREKLQYYLEANSNMQSAFNYLRGNDVLVKICNTALNACRRNMKNIERCEEIENIPITKIRQGIAEEDPTYIFN